VVGLRWLMVVANLQLGAVDEAEHLLADTVADRTEDPTTYAVGLGAQAEVLLVRGQIDAGLRLWRRTVELVEQIRDPSIPRFPLDLDPWTLEVRAVAVVAHARHGHVDEVAGIVAQFPGQVTTILTQPVPNPPPYLMEFPISGTILLALATADLAQGRHLGNAARMTALAERLRYLRSSQPTMSSARARAAAVAADRAAYDEAVSSYAHLDRERLRAEALALLDARL
jgi:hypothetical protein